MFALLKQHESVSCQIQKLEYAKLRSNQAWERLIDANIEISKPFIDKIDKQFFEQENKQINEGIRELEPWIQVFRSWFIDNHFPIHKVDQKGLKTRDWLPEKHMRFIKKQFDKVTMIKLPVFLVMRIKAVATVSKIPMLENTPAINIADKISQTVCVILDIPPLFSNLSISSTPVFAV